MSGLYVYAVIPGGEPRSFDVAGLWPADPKVVTIPAGGLAAVVGAAPPVDFHALPREEAVRYLLAHQRVAEVVMRDTPALPVRFGTVLPNEPAVIGMLERGQTVLTPRLAQFSRHVQIELIVSWNLEEVLREIATEDAVVQLKAALEAAPSTTTGDLKVALGRLVKAAIDSRREIIRNRILEVLAPIAADMVENALMDDGMVANVALLLPEEASQTLDQRLAELDAEFGGRLNFRCVGPLPPSSFATVEVLLPSFDLVDQARRLLHLGTSARLIEIKSAYRRLIRQNHPDLQAAESAANDQTAQLTDAYKTLLGYARAGAGSGDDGVPAGADCRFDRGTVERAVSVAVRRQEVSAIRLGGQP
ncbi:MAG: GvpL/GvpF family gas vesicle protein [Devosia sp.]|nr:GvpL/GvpF family gas vesicle protein [Devosia sp.]